MSLTVRATAGALVAVLPVDLTSTDETIRSVAAAELRVDVARVTVERLPGRRVRLLVDAAEVGIGVKEPAVSAERSRREYAAKRATERGGRR